MEATKTARTSPVTAARTTLVERNIGLLYRVATGVYHALGRSVDFDELVSLGSIGLIQAADRFDPNRGVKFRTFAYYRIRGAMYDGLGKIGPLPRHMYRTRRIATERLQSFMASDSAELAGETGRGNADTIAITEALRTAASLFVTSFETLEEDDGPLPDTTACRPDQSLCADDLKQRLVTALATLPETERALLTMHYHEDRTLQDAGAELGISKSWASRIHARAIRKLRRVLDKQEVI